MSVQFVTSQGTKLISTLWIGDFCRTMHNQPPQHIHGHPRGQPHLTIYADTRHIVEWFQLTNYETP